MFICAINTAQSSTAPTSLTAGTTLWPREEGKERRHAGRYGSALAPLAAKDGTTLQGGGGNGPPMARPPSTALRV